MAASVRVAGVVGATYPGNSAGRGTSRGSLSGASVRVADVVAESASTTAVVRVADVTAYVGGGSIAYVRVADVIAEAPTATYVWDGTQWIPVGPPGVGLSQSTGASAGSLGSSVPLAAQSAGNGRSAGSLSSTFTGSITAVGTGVVSITGVKDQAPGSGSGTINVTGTGTVTITGTASQGPPGQGSLTVTADPVNSPPRVVLSLAGALGTTVTIVRIDRAGNQSPVRLASPGQLNAGGWVGFDYEAPFNAPVTYQATASRVITSDPVTLAVSAPWLIHPGIPALSVPLTVVSRGDRTRDSNQGVHAVLGRRDPIVISDGVRRSAVFDLVVRSGLDVDEAAACTETDLDDLLADTSTLLLQHTYGGRRSFYGWVSVGQVTVTDLVESYFEGDYQHWTLPCTTTVYPAGMLQSQRTWAGLIAEQPTWRDVVANYATWRDVITGTQS